MNDREPAPERKKRSVGRRICRALVKIVAALVVFVVVVGVVGAWALRASLPRESGEVKLAGLTAPVTVERDALAVPVIRGKTLEDVCRAEGFVHAQERFFQMDLSRRGAAGEISELLGKAGVAIDVEGRPLRFRTHAREVLERLPEAHRRMLRAYTEGVNAGLADLGMRPPEYLLLRATPAAWKEEDCLLVVFLMFRFLNYTSVNEKQLGTMEGTLPKELVEFLTPETTRWDVPLSVRDPAAEMKTRQKMGVPGPEVVDLRKSDGATKRRSDAGENHEPRDKAGLLTFADLRELVMGEGITIGSNNWAVAGSRSVHGGAMVANDMHLGINAPNTWYRVQLEWEEAATERRSDGATEGVQKRRAVGVSLPGAPAIVAGTNGHLAWGFTNVEADVQDLVIVEADPTDAGKYLVPGGSEAFGEIVETINIHGGDSQTLRLITTRWGVVTDKDYKGRPLVLKWAALEPDKVNLGVFDMLGARTVDEGVAVTRRMFIPPQNVVMADENGRIAWCVCGWLPKRVGFDGKFPRSWAQAGADGKALAWDGQIDEADRPCVIDPPSGVLFSANNRTTGWPECRLVGNSWSPSDRAHRIGEMLGEKAKLDERDLLRIQLDVKAETLEYIRALVREMHPDSQGNVGTADDLAAGLVFTWDDKAGAESAAFRIVRAFQRELERRVFAALTAQCKSADSGFAYNWFLSDEPLQRILEDKPAHLLPPAAMKNGSPAYTDWDGFLRDAWDATVEKLDHASPIGLNAWWGNDNKLRARHHLSQGVPFLGRWLDLPNDPMPGASMTVRAQGRGFGASERYVVSPGREESAIFEMPGGQSGHFVSKHYTDGHAAWVRGDPTPLLAGNAEKTLIFKP